MSFEDQPLLDGTGGRLDVIHELLSQEVKFEQVLQNLRKNKEQWNKYRNIPDSTGELAKVFEILDIICSPDFYTKYKIISLSNFHVSYKNETFDVKSIYIIYEITKTRDIGNEQLRMYAQQFINNRCVYDLQEKCILDARNILGYMNSVLPPDKVKSLNSFLLTLQDNQPDDVQEFAWLVHECMIDLKDVALKIHKQIDGEDVRDWLAWVALKTKRSQSQSVKTTFGSRGQKRQERAKKTIRLGGLKSCLYEVSHSPSPCTRSGSDDQFRDMHRLLHEL
jgi:pyruvate-formate lyase-activating enzyme